MENPFQRIEENHNDLLEGHPIDMSRIMKDIFASCDPENSGFVLVSQLIDFITPFLQGNKDALEQLQTALDSEKKNPLIDSVKFYNAMNKWANKISHQGDDVKDFHNVTPRDLDHLDSGDMPFAHSTPRSSFGHHLLKSYVESGILNASNTSTYSYTPNNATGCTDKVFYEDQIHELEHKNKKLNEEMMHVRQELAICADQNEILQSDVERLTKRLANQEKAYEQLMKEKKCEEDCEEALNQAQKQIIKMKHNLSAYTKMYNTSKELMDDLKADNLNLQSKTAHLNKMNDEFKATINALQAMIDLKEQEITTLQEFNANLQNKIKTHNETLEQYKAKIDTLKVEKKLLSDRIAKENSSPITNKSIPSKSSTPNNYESPNNLSQNSQNSSLLDSSEEDICSRHRLSVTPQSQYVSLQAEIAQATEDNIEHECDLNIKLIESENKIISLQFELMKHQNCEAIMEKNRQEIEDLKLQIRDGKDVVTELADLKNDLSLGQDREIVLHERCCELSEKLNKSKSFVTEIKVKLEEHCDLQASCEEFRARVESLETENSLKYIRIVELTMENDRLQEEVKQNIKIKQLLTTALKDKEKLEQTKQELEKDVKGLKIEAEVKTEISEAKSKTLEARNESLKRLERENDKLQVKIMSLERSMEVESLDLLEKISNLQAEVMKLEENKQNLDEIIIFKEQELEKKMQELIEIHAAELKKLDEKCKLLEANNFDVQETITSLKDVCHKLKQEEVVLKAANVEFKTRNETLRLALNDAKSELERSNAENEMAKGRLLKEKEELRTKLEKNEFNSKKQDMESKKLSVELTALKLAHGKTAENLENLQKSISAMQDEKLELQQTILERKIEQEELHKTIADLKRQLDLEMNSAEQIRKDFNNNLNELQVIQDRENSLKAKMIELNKSNESLTLEICYLKKLNAKLNEDLLSATEENAKLSKQIEDLVSDRESKIRLIEIANEKLISAQSQMRCFEDKLLKSDSVLEVNCLDEIEKLKNKIEIDESEARKLNEAKSELENELKLLMDDKKEIENKLEELMLEKEEWLTEKVTGESCNNCRTLEAKLGRKSGFDRLAIKAHKLEQKAEELEDQLLKEKSQNIDAMKKASDEKEQLEIENKTLYGEKLVARRKLIGALKTTAKLERENKSLTEEIRLLKCKLTELENGSEFAAETDAAGKLKGFRNANDVLHEARLKLSKSTLDMANSWNLFFGNNVGLDEFWRMFAEDSPSCSDEVALLKHQIDATIILLTSFLAVKSPDMNQSDETLQEADLQRVTQSSKLLKKFTLKPPTLIVRPVSPDSPSMDGLCEKFSAVGDCPDSVGDNFPSPSLMNNLEQFKQDNGDACSSNLVILEQEASPNLNTEVLEDLGLLGDNVRLSEKETEEKFTAIVLAFTIDNASLSKRMRKQKDVLISRENALAMKLGDLLDVIKGYLTEEQFANVSSQTEDIIGICAQGSISAGQFGALQHEHHLVKTVAVMINYAAILRKKLDSNRNQSPHMLPFHPGTNPKLNKKSSISSEVGNAVIFVKDLQNDNQSRNSDSRKKFDSLKKVGFLLALIWTASFIYSSIFGNNASCSNPNAQYQRSYPWSWLSWDELLDHFVSKEFRDGPPPT